MCARDPKMRPTIAEVLEVLEDFIKADPSWHTINLEQFYPDLIDHYRWSDSLHHLFGERELIVFLRASNRDNDAKTLSDMLKAEKLFGFTIMRLLGEYDLLLRVWRRHVDKGLLESVLKRFDAERGKSLLFAPELHLPASATSEKLGLSQPSDGLALLDELSRVKTKRRHAVILGETKARREVGKGTKAIRAVCWAVATRPLTKKLAEVIGATVHTQLAKVRAFGLVEVFVDTRTRGNAEFLVIAESKQFHKFPLILDALDSALKELGDAPPSRTVTHFELDVTAPFESYDGRLGYELHRYNRMRHDED